MLVPVAHFQREPYSTFGNPFLIKIKEGETYEEIKERIRAHLDVPEKDFEKYRYMQIDVQDKYFRQLHHCTLYSTC